MTLVGCPQDTDRHREKKARAEDGLGGIQEGGSGDAPAPALTPAFKGPVVCEINGCC